MYTRKQRLEIYEHLLELIQDRDYWFFFCTNLSIITHTRLDCNSDIEKHLPELYECRDEGRSSNVWYEQLLYPQEHNMIRVLALLYAIDKVKKLL